MDFIDLAACGDNTGIKAALADSATTVETVNGLDKDGRSAFHYSCLNDDLTLFNMLVADSRVKIDLTTPKGDTGLHLASLYASLRVMDALLSDPRGKKLLNAQNNYGETPLHLCAGSGDKQAGKAAKRLLEAGGSLTITDKWKRGPCDVSSDNAENPLVKVFEEFLSKAGKEAREAVDKVTKAYKAEAAKKVPQSAQNKQKTANFLSELGKGKPTLKQVVTEEKSVFKPLKKSKDSSKGKGQDIRGQGKILSKLVEAPGDVEEITKLLERKDVSAGGADSYGVRAIHKFAAWNKPDLMALLIPKLTLEELNATDTDGLTALHYACEMGAVASVEYLVSIPDVDKDIKDKKGRTPLDILNTGSGAIVDRLKSILAGDN